ncbi:MAG TPA: hypothetical protein VEC36_01905 [Patescibacteria group bacterium]|nr:hypothetical protein [Patescibacteria group bacterium]
MKIFALLLCSLIAIILSCGSNFIHQTHDVRRKDSIKTEYYVIHIDSIASPSQVEYGKSFTAAFYGIVGGNSCYSLDRIERKDILSGEVISFYGRYESGPNIGCFDAVAFLGRMGMITDDGRLINEGKLLEFIPEKRGVYIISVIQPDGSFLSDTTIVQ